MTDSGEIDVLIRQYVSGNGRHHLLFFVERIMKKNLIAAAIGQDGSFPTDKLMQAACLFKNTQSWSEVKMISITQNDLSFAIFI